MKPVYFQLSPNDAVARLRSDLMLSVAPATEQVVWPGLGGAPNKLAPFGKDVAYSEGDIVRESYLLNFTNKEIDYNLDLHYFGARYYTAGMIRLVTLIRMDGYKEDGLDTERSSSSHFSVIHLAGGNTEIETASIPNASEPFENTQTTVYRQQEQ